MFEGWDNFFLLLGSASAALIGLLFIVTTLASSLRVGSETMARGAALYMTPTLFHYTTVLVMSALATVPGLTGGVMAAVLGPWSLAGVGYCAVMAVLVRSRRLPDSGTWTDALTYGVLPGLIYLGLIAGAWSAARGAANAPYAIAIGLTVLIILGIRNAWDLITFIAPRSVGDAAGEGQK